ncbi:MAG: SDR family NAD(P)-dependent oxidoreductase [Candidatus Bathyarchaeia archaeon]
MNRLAKRMLKELSKVDILVNNATMAKTGSILELPLEEWNHCYDYL